MATPFDRAAWLAAVEPPRFRDGETEYVGRILSAPEWWRIEAQLEAAGTLDGPGVMRLIRTLTDRIFPRPWWQVWRPKVSTLLFRLPLPAQLDAFRSFVEALRRIHQTTAGPTPPNRPSPEPSSTSST